MNEINDVPQNASPKTSPKIINTKALVEHDAVIEDHCHISTGAVVNGGVRIGSGSFFGSNAVCKEYIEIGESAVIGCGAIIVKNIPQTP